MGRGNVCVFGDYEGLYFIDRDRFEAFELDENEEPDLEKPDYELSEMQWEEDLDQFMDLFTRKYKSFSRCDKWVNSDARAVLESKLFYIAVVDNEWSMCIQLLQKEPNGDFNNEGLQAGLYDKYLDGIKECLFNLYTELGVYRGAWTSGTIKRPDDFKFMKIA